jgi:hypothetical protein
VGDPFAAIVGIWASTTPIELLAIGVIVALIATLISLGYDYLLLWKSRAKLESELLLATVDKDSTNWEDAALELERKTEDPALAARSTAMTHLHMLEQAASAWRRASKWTDALRVTRQLLSECCHAIIKPSINQDDFRATADVIERVLDKYPDLSKAANEHVDNAVAFLAERDAVLSVLPNSMLIKDLRDHLAAARAAIEEKRNGKSAAE